MGVTVLNQRDMEVPEVVKKALLREGGTNPYGEPRYRFVWGWRRFDWKLVAPEMNLQWETKYPRKDRFHLEVWVPSAFYGSPAEWETKEYQYINGVHRRMFGPYPNRGGYEHLWICETPEGGYLLPTEEIAVRAVRHHRRALAQSREAIRSGIAQDVAGTDPMKVHADELEQCSKDFVSQAIKGRTLRELREDLMAHGTGRRAA